MIRYQRKIKANKNGHINVSKSGLSHSQKIDKFTFNSNGTVSYNSSIKGLSFRMNTFIGLCVMPIYYLIKLSIFVLIKLPIKLIVLLAKKLAKKNSNNLKK